MGFLNSLSIKNKIIFITLLINILIVGALLLFIAIKDIQTYRKDVANSVIVDTKLVGDYSAIPLVWKDKKRGNQTLKALNSIPEVVFAQLYTKDNEVLCTYSRGNKTVSSPHEALQPYFEFKDEFLYVYNPVFHKGEHIGAVYIVTSTDDLQKRINSYISLFIILLIASITISYILAIYFQKLISAPILELADVTQKISTNEDYSIRVKKESDDETGTLIESFNAMIDAISKRERERDVALEKHKISEERFKKIASSANDSIIVLDRDGNVSFWNQASEKIFGYSVDEIQGQNFHLMCTPSEYHADFHKGFNEFQKTGKGKIVGTSREIKARRKDGSIFDAEISISATKIKDEWHSVGIVKDITLRKETEANLLAAKQQAVESDKLKSAFLANMSHEIRTPMNAIVGFTDLLRRPEIAESKRKQFIEIIHKNNNILLKLIDDILDISKIEAGQITINNADFKPCDLLIELKEFFQKDKQFKDKHLVELRYRENTQLKPDIQINTDKIRLRQVLVNLISNALKFTENGYIEFGYTFVNEYKTIQFYVKDTGIGIENNKKDLIFSRFRQVDNTSTRKYGGTGLGLAISKGLIDLMRGNIWFESILDHGTTFFIEFPYEYKEDQKVKTVKKKKQIGTYNWSDKTILVVEDEESNVELIKEALSSTGAELLWARDGKPGVEICKTNDKIDLVLMDIQMPVMNGYEATRKIKELRPELPIIAQTAYAMENEKEKSMDAGCIAYLTKPLKIKHFLSTIDKYLQTV